jgi:hypothetical protein
MNREIGFPSPPLVRLPTGDVRFANRGRQIRERDNREEWNIKLVATHEIQ